MLYTDGGFRIPLNKGAWAYILTKDDVALIKDSVLVRDATSNRAEYLGIISGMIAAAGICKDLTCVSDSQLMVRQINGTYKVNDPVLWQFWHIVQQLRLLFDTVEFEWRSRETPWIQKCDALCDGVIDG